MIVTSHQSPPHVLVVNAADELRSLYEDVLMEEGYTVSVIPHLPQDLNHLPELRADLILLDDMWGVSADRRPALECLSRHPRTRRVPIVFCTGAVRLVEPLMPQLGDTNITIVFKPFDLDDLLGHIASALSLVGDMKAQPCQTSVPAEMHD